jgi:sulfur-oxidizing protein SoxX
MSSTGTRLRSFVIAAASLAVVAAAIVLLLPEAAMAGSVDDAVKSSWSKLAPDWQARLVQDETQKVCSETRNAPSRAVAEAILAREKAAIVYPSDGKLMGDWKKGELLAQSGYGGRFTDYPPRA